MTAMNIMAPKLVKGLCPKSHQEADMGTFGMLESLGIRIGDVLTIIAFLGGGVGFVYTIRGRVDALSQQVIGMQLELKKLVDIMVMQGRHEERIDAIDQRLLAQGKRTDELATRVNKWMDEAARFAPPALPPGRPAKHDRRKLRKLRGR